ncbi:MAG: hypothetical protein V3W04_12940 [Gammaproteobacteria bacterium]
MTAIIGTAIATPASLPATSVRSRQQAGARSPASGIPDYSKPQVESPTYTESVTEPGDILYGEVLPKNSPARNASTQSFLLERTLMRAKPATTSQTATTTRSLLQADIYQSMHHSSHTSQAYSGVDYYV